MKFFMNAVSVTALMLSAGAAFADTMGCNGGGIVVKFAHVTNTGRHPKGIAASLLQERVNADMDGVMCMEVFPNSTLYSDDQVLEAMLQGDVQLAAPSLSKFEAFTKQFRIFDLPFMLRNRAGDAGFHAASRPSGSGVLAQWYQSHVRQCRV